MNKVQTIKKGLLLLGSFAIAYDLGILFHELSHGLVAILTGGTFSDMVINPLSWSYSYSYSPNQIVHVSAGALGAVLIASVIYLILYWKANPWLFPFLLIAPIALMDNGAYYIVDIIMHSGGDASGLMEIGVHPATLIILGVACVVIGLILAFFLMRKIGLLYCDLKKRLAIVGIGIFPWAFAMLVWNFIYNRNETLLWSLYSIITIVLAIVVALLPKGIWEQKSNTFKPLNWKTVFSVNLLYTGLLIFWFVGPFSANNVFGVETFSERPEDFPSVMVAPDYAMDTNFFRSSVAKRPYCLCYNLPESIPFDPISDYVTNLHEQHGYILLTHSIDDPNRVLNNDWKEVTEQIDGVLVTTKQYCQFWMKVAPQPLMSFVTVYYIWKEGKFETASVMDNIIEYPEYEQLYDYAQLHPEQFDSNEIEQLRELSELRRSKNNERS